MVTDADVDEAPVKPEPCSEFDCMRPWPERYKGSKFGPSLIWRALKSGRYVLAELDGIKDSWAVSDARWDLGLFQVETVYGWREPMRVRTVDTLKGIKI